MSILNIKEKFSKRILKGEEEIKKKLRENNGMKNVAVPFQRNDIQETDAGITGYVSDLPGFHAVIKQRYSDFNVHEIGNDGSIAILNNFEVPDESVPEVSKPTSIPESTFENLEKLANKDESVTEVKIDVTGFSKEDRKNVHQYIKRTYGCTLVSNTVDDDDKKILCVTRSSGARERQPSHIPKHLHFILSKSNMETMEALNIIASKLKFKGKNFMICGTKDKRGNTSQWVSVKQILASRLNNLNKTLRRMKVGNFVYKDYSLALGALKGNNFQIALRDLTASDEEVNYALEKLRENGFINYFGLQRFGKCAESPTYEIGREIIKESYGSAIDLILKPRGDIDSPDLKQAREIWARTKNAGQALSAVKNKDRTIEGKLLFGLKKHGPTAYVNALDELPRNVRLLYIHSYQSLVWNKVASRRVAKYGLKVLEGDLVFINNSDEPTVPGNDEEHLSEIENEEAKEKTPIVRPLASDELDSFSIYDVVLPLPGRLAIYPNNELAEWYIEILAEDGFNLESFTSRVKKYSLQGAYRKILQRPQNLTWKIVRYSQPSDDLILSDIDKLEGVTLPDRPDGKLKAVILNFDLTSSTYATMALREILRADTSASSQTLLQNSSIKRQGEDIQNGIVKRRKTDEQTNESMLPEKD